MNNFHFLRPGWFFLGPFMVILLWLYHRRKTVSRSWRAVCDPNLLPHLLIGNAEGDKGRKILIVLTLSAGLALIALAGPVWKQLEQPVFRDQSALVLVLDLSRSMDAEDIRPARLVRARLKMIDILKNRREGLTALVVFAAEPFVVSPLTNDSETIISQVSALKTSLMPRQGSRPDLALKKAGQLLEQTGVPRGRVLIITDGADNVPKEKLDKAVLELNQQGHSLYVLGVGTTDGAPIKLAEGGFLKDNRGAIVIPKLDETALNALARQGGGHYRRLSVDDHDVDILMGENLRHRLENKTEATDLKTDRWREEGPWLLLPLLPIAALAFRRGILTVVFLLSMMSLMPVQAFDWETLWSRQDQRAANMFEEGKMEGAAELFENLEWKATSYYRAGKYQESVELLEGIDEPDAFYNKGNGLAKLGKLSEAIQAYDEALKRQPDHEDARYNKEQLLQLIDQENQDQESQQDGEASESEDGESSEDSGEDPSEEQQGRQTQSFSDDERASERDEEGDSEEAEHNGDNESQDQEAPSEDDKDRRVARAEEDEHDESQLANEQWLRRIPDDPGGLLRRKFLFQSKQRKRVRNEERAW